MDEDHIKQIAAKAGGVVALSLKLGLSRSAVSQWKRVPSDRIVEVERLTGVPREQIRPDLFERSAAAAPLQRHAQEVGGAPSQEVA